MTWAFNLILPGTGLIIVQREWLGFALCLLFGIGLNGALAGGILAPESAPNWLIAVCAASAAFFWVVSQIMLCRHQNRKKVHPPLPVLPELPVV